jgi:hypothetical protein
LPDYCFAANNRWTPRVSVDPAVCKFGARSMRLDGPGYFWQVCKPPPGVDVKGKYVFSMWLKGSAPGMARAKGFGAFSETMKVGTEWTRHEFPCELKDAGNLWLTIFGMPEGNILWVDGLQLERGKRATEFTAE